MQKITCPICGKQFIWTDESPLQGKCPNVDCEWQYDVRKEIGKGLAKRTERSAPSSLTCPVCGHSLVSAWTRCDACGTLILAHRPLKKLHILFIGAVILVLLSLSYCYYF
ncbi:MAG: hypothetical protein JW902_13555 [Syntrophaceae bacterium]|nr:hypothetical protein [Syntrophaceae bacterium]